MEMKRKKISVTSLILPVIMLVVAVVLPVIYSTNYYIQLFSQTLADQPASTTKLSAYRDYLFIIISHNCLL